MRQTILNFSAYNSFFQHNIVWSLNFPINQNVSTNISSKSLIIDN
jgi:hypothetical protein